MYPDPDKIAAVLQYLMYYEEDGKRVYTLKVRFCLPWFISFPSDLMSLLNMTPHASRRAKDSGNACNKF